MRGDRPLLNNVDPALKLEQLMRDRAPIYEALADVTVSTDGRRVRSVAEDILRALDHHAVQTMANHPHDPADI